MNVCLVASLIAIFSSYPEDGTGPTERPVARGLNLPRPFFVPHETEFRRSRFFVPNMIIWNGVLRKTWSTRALIAIEEDRG